MTATCATCGEARTFTVRRDALAWLTDHDNTHRGLDVEVHQLPSVTFHEQALLALRALAATGRRFTTGEAHQLVTAVPVNPQTDWPKAVREAEALGWIAWTGDYAPSVVPTTKGSAVKVWIGTAKAAAA